MSKMQAAACQMFATANKMANKVSQNKRMRTQQTKIAMSIQTMIREMADYFKTQPVTKAWLFGSYARGEETLDSDIDILVKYDENARISLLTISHMMGEIEQRIGRRVDLVEEGCLLPFAVETANRDKQLIFERKN